MNKKGRLGISLFSSMIAMVVSLGVSFFLTPFLISKLGKETYSFFPLANNFVGYMNIISIALNSMASRFITISMASGETEKSKGYFSSVFYSNVILCAILLVPMIVIIAFLQRFLDVPTDKVYEIKILFSLIFASLLIQLVFSVYGVATFAKERMDLNAYQNIGQNILRACLYIALFKLLPTSIVIMGVVTTILMIYNGCVQLIFCKKLLPNYRIQRSYFNVSFVGELLSSGAWNSLNNIGTSLLQTMMLLMANVLISVSASGDMSIVQTLPNLMTTIISTVFGVLLPHIANIYAQGKSEDTISSTIYTQKILSAISVVPVILIIILGKQFYSLWIPGEDASSLQVLSIVTVAPLLIHSSMWMFYGLNIMNNRVKWPAIVFLFSGIINILATSIIVKYTSLGLITIPLVSGVINIAYYLLFIPTYSAKEMGVSKKTFYPLIARSIFYGIFACLIGVPIFNNIIIKSWVNFFLYTSIIGIVLEIIFCFIIFERRELDNILRWLKNINPLLQKCDKTRCTID